MSFEICVFGFTVKVSVIKIMVEEHGFANIGNLNFKVGQTVRIQLEGLAVPPVVTITDEGHTKLVRIDCGSSLRQFPVIPSSSSVGEPAEPPLVRTILDFNVKLQQSVELRDAVKNSKRPAIPTTSASSEPVSKEAKKRKVGPVNKAPEIGRSRRSVVAPPEPPKKTSVNKPQKPSKSRK